MHLNNYGDPLGYKTDQPLKLYYFARTHAHHIWTSERHRKESLGKLERLSLLSDFDVKPISDFKAKDVYFVIDYLQDEELASATINRYLACLSVVLKHAVALEVLDRLPVFKWQKESEGRKRHFTDAEYQSLIKFFRYYPKVSWMADYVILGVETGMRRGEILAINNPGGKVIGQLIDNGDFIHLSNTKNGSERIVPLNDKAKAALARLDNQPYKVWSHRNFYDYWGLARGEIAPGDMTFCFHTCRHTAATKLILDLDCDAIAVAEFLGHKSLSTTKKYVSTKKDSLKRMAYRLQGVA